MKNVFVLLTLLSATLGMGACAGRGAAGNTLNSPAAAASAAAVPSRGCYDHKGRIERTVTTEGECRVLDWVWKA